MSPARNAPIARERPVYHQTQERGKQKTPGEDNQADYQHGIQNGVFEALQQRGRFRGEQRHQCQQRDHGQILEKQNGKGRLAMARAHFTPLGKDLETERRRGECQSEADDHRHLEGLIEQEGQTGNGQPGHHHLCGAQPEHHAPHGPEARGPQLYADDEQQEDDTELGDIPDFIDPVDNAQSPGTDKGAGGQVPQHRTELQPLKDRNRNDRRRQQYQNIFEVMGFCHIKWALAVGCKASITHRI